MIKAVIFDLNGIFIQSQKLSDRFEEKFGVTSIDFITALKDIMPKVRIPNAGDSFEYWKPYLEKWDVSLNKEEFFDFWFTAEKENTEMITLTKELKNQGMKVYVLSNNFSERAQYYDKTFSFLKDSFDKIYYSWQTGFIKPDEKAYQNLLKENELQPKECIYFDDSQDNIDVANNLGIHSFIFVSPTDIRSKIAQLK